VFLLTKPDSRKIRALVDSQAGNAFSYTEVGASRASAPPSYNVDYNRVLLGHGRETFCAAISALNDCF